MSSNLPLRSFKAFAVVEALRSGSADIRSALVPFFHPILAFANGKIFNPGQICAEANAAYHWSITDDIVEGLTPSFVDQGWITPIETSDQLAAFRINCYLPDGIFASSLSDSLLELGSSFQKFIEEISPLSCANRSPEELINILLRWIVSLEAYSDSDLKTEIIKSAQDGKRTIYDVVNTASGISQDDQFLCARFSSHLVSINSDLVKIISDVARIGLLTEAVQDFAKPVTSVQRTSLSVYLDTPVAMDYLDVSGAAARQNIRPIIDRLKQIGASIRVFDTSLDEIQRNLSALLRRPEPTRTGVTATAIRRGQVLESYVRQVAARPDQALAALGVQVASRTLDQYPNHPKFFTDEDYKNLYSNINWHFDDAPRAHDALVVTNIMRMRRGTQSSDIFETGHILVTRNGILPGAAKRIALSEGRLGARSVGPVVHQRELATAVWLRAGLETEEQEALPLKYLMASCERVLQLRPDVIEKVRQQAKARSPETAEQLDLLLAMDRSSEMLMDKTLNISSVISSDNIELLINDMKESLISEKVAEQKAAIADIRSSARKNVAQAKSEAEKALEREASTRQEALVEAERLNSYIAARDAEDLSAVETLIFDANASIARKISNTKKAISAILIFFEIGSALVAWHYPNAGTGILLAALSVVLFSHLSGMITRLLPYGEVSNETASAIAWTLANERGISAKLQRFSLGFDGGELFLDGPIAAKLPDE